MLSRDLGALAPPTVSPEQFLDDINLVRRTHASTISGPAGGAVAAAERRGRAPAPVRLAAWLPAVPH